MSLPEVDGPSHLLFQSACPNPDTPEALTEAFAALCGAAAWAAVLLSEHAETPARETWGWGEYGRALLAIADLYTFGSDRSREDVAGQLRCLLSRVEALGLAVKRERGE